MSALERPHRSASPCTTALLSGWCRARSAASPAAGDCVDRAGLSRSSAGVGPLSPTRCYVGRSWLQTPAACRPFACPGTAENGSNDMDCPPSIVHRVIMAVVSDDHNAEVGEAAVREIVAGVGLIGGSEGLEDLAVELAFKVAELVERVAAEQGVAAVDLADILFVD